MSEKTSRWKKGFIAIFLAALPIILFWAIKEQRATQIEDRETDASHKYIPPPTQNAITGTEIGSVEIRFQDKGYDNPIYLLAFGQDGRKLWSFTAREMQQWDIDSSKQILTRPLGAQHSFPPPSMPVLSADAQTFITSDRDSRDHFYVKLWDVQSGRLKRTVRVSDSMEYQRHAALSSNNILATHNAPPQGFDKNRIYYGEQIKTWNAQTGVRLQLIQLPGLNSHTSTTVSCLDITRDGSLVAAGLQDGRIGVWDARTGQEVKQWQDNSKNILVSKNQNSSFYSVPGISQITFSPDGEILATASGDDTVRLWKPRTGRLLRAIQTPTGSFQPPLAFSPDGKWLASSGSTTYVSVVSQVDFNGRVWDVQTGKLHATLQQDQKRFLVFAFSPDSQTLASSDAKGAIKLWKIP